MRLDVDWISAPGPRAVMAALAGHQAYFVGGCVRNGLMGLPAGDIDIATSARPKQTMKAAEAAGLRAVPTGMDHGTITVVVDGEGYEVTTFRRDVATDGRRAVVAFADTIAQDALRRDFTMNALYAAADGTVHDPLGGLPDLQARRVRFIQDPHQRIAEDYLRILRFFRFHAIYGDPAQGLDAEGLAACAEGADGLTRLSKERIGAEMIKLLSAPNPAPSVAAMAHTGVLMQVLPGADARFLPVLVHLEAIAKRAPHWTARLAVMGGDDPAPLLRLSRAQVRHMGQVRQALAHDTSVAEVAYRFGPDVAWDTGLCRAASLEQAVPLGMAAEIDQASRAVFPVSAKDVPDLSGKALGDRLKELEMVWIKSGFSVGKAELLKR